MLESSESRDFIRMETRCNISYKFPDSNDVFMGKSINISGSGILFLTSQSIDTGIALEVTVMPEKSLTPPMIAYVEVIRSKEIKPGEFEIAGEIKGIKES
ncbi:MAG: PilZ domain-containing protein [Methyloprofundus sp.]|nr:PilZ domain-containing protein [Methyloprofundus sp.]